MKKLSKSKVFLVVLLAVILGIMAIGTKVSATDEGNGVVIIGPGSSTTNSADNQTDNNATNPANNVTNYNATNNTSNTLNLPKTGIEDYSIGIGIVVICAISAIFAYKKVRDYKI